MEAEQQEWRFHISSHPEGFMQANEASVYSVQSALFWPAVGDIITYHDCLYFSICPVDRQIEILLLDTQFY